MVKESGQMAIDKIKELIHFQNWPNVTELTIEQKTIITIADYLIQEHEQKEDDFVIEHKPKVSIPVTITIDTPVVEVGQIWRNKATGKAYEIVNFNEFSKTVSFGNHYEETLYEHLSLYYELVTMQNIKHGEYAKCTNIKRIKDEDKCNYFGYGDVLKVKEFETGEIALVTDKGQNCVFINSEAWLFWFKPCLQPIAEEEKGEKPPTGLRPKFIVDEHRVQEIDEAIKRYEEVGKDIPEEWKEELRMLISKEKLYTQEDLDRTAIQEYNKGKAVGEVEGYKDGYKDAYDYISREMNRSIQGVLDRDDVKSHK